MTVGARRAAPSVAAWSVAAVAAVAVASWGVALVGRSVTDSRPAPLSAAQVQERLAAAPAGSDASSTTTPPGTPTTSEPAPSEPASSVVPGPGSDPGSTPTSARPSSPAGTAATAAPSAPATTSPPETPAPAPAPAPTETRTYPMVGGTVALRFEPAGVTVVYATPAAGFEVEVEPDHGTGVKVEFESETHRSRVTGWWDGAPQDRVEERPDSDDDD